MRTTASPMGIGPQAGGTLVSVLVLVILGLIVWTLLMPREGDRGKRYLAAVRSDLRNLVTAQEEYYESYGTYAPRSGAIASTGTFTSSAGVTIAVTSGTDAGWSAVGRHEAAPEDVCAVHVGALGPYAGRQWRPEHEGEPVCRTRRDLRRAAKEVERACEDGHAPSCYHAAVLHSGGWGADQDSARAAAFFEQACAGGHAAGCIAVGTQSAEGSGGADMVRADSAFRRACRAGDATGCGGAAVALAERACARGDSTGCTGLADRYRTGDGVTPDLDRAAALYHRACGAGDTSGCSRLIQLAREHRMAHQEPRDMSWAADLYEKACRLKVAAGCAGLTELATGYWVNRPGPVSGVIAAGLLEKACGGGDSTGCSHLITLYERSCADDEPWACSRLGDRYRGGRGVPQDAARAAVLIAKACDGGSAPDCYHLGRMLLAGEGVTPDSARAATLLRSACDKGVLDACRYVRDPSSP